MNTLLWTGQILLAITFLYSGVCKSFYSEKQLIAKGQTGIAGLATGLIRFIGITEILGSVGILLPWWAGILPVLTPVTAICFGLIMMMAAPIHYRLKEPRNVAVNITLLVVSILVAVGRWQQI